MIKEIVQNIEESIAVKQQILKSEETLDLIRAAAITITHAFQDEGKVLFCGNGGSAADAQHLSAELSGRFKFDREPLDAEALHVNSSYITAVANDYGYEQIFSRLIAAKAKRGDVLIGLSTSGESKNIIKAFEKAREIKNISCISLTGAGESTLDKLSHITIKVPSTDTARIQEAHIMIGHIICGLVEQSIYGKATV